MKSVKGKKVLEMGCGTGLYVYLFKKQNKDVTGIEIDKRRLGIAKKELKNFKVKLVEGDIRKMPFSDEEFDYVFCHGVIEHFPDSEKAVKEGYRVLKNKGKAMYSVPCKLSFFVPLKILQKIIDKIFKTELWKRGYEKSFTARKFKKVLKKQRFKIIKFKISENREGRRIPIVGKILRWLDKPFFKLGIGGRFMFALCEK